jgi:hypothetical protein
MNVVGTESFDYEKSVLQKRIQRRGCFVAFN